MDEFERSFESIEALLEDPTVKEIVDKVRQLNETLAENPAISTEATRIIDELNYEWKEAGLKDETMRFTGKAWAMLVPRGYVEDTEISPEYYLQAINQKTVVNGFSLLESNYIDEEGIRTVQEIYLNGATLVDDAEGIKKKSYIDIICSLQPNESTLFYEGITGDRARQWFELYYPNELEELGRACENARDEAEVIMNLREYKISLENTNKETAKELKKNFKALLKDVIKVEKHFPYILRTRFPIKKVGFNAKGEKEYQYYDHPISQATYLIANEILCEKTDDKKYIAPCIQSAIIQSDRKTLLQTRVPFGSIENIYSTHNFIDSHLDELQN